MVGFLGTSTRVVSGKKKKGCYGLRPIWGPAPSPPNLAPGCPQSVFPAKGDPMFIGSRKIETAAVLSLRFFQQNCFVPYRYPQNEFGGCLPYKILYTPGMDIRQPIEFRGSSLEDLRAFPLAAKREAGHQLDLVQIGQEPDDWKPMNTVGQGVREIRIRDSSGIFRVIYVAKFSEAIYVLHCFQKKTQKTSKADMDLATRRYKDLVQELMK